MCEVPFIDWDGNGRIDPSDIAVSLAASEEYEYEEDEDVCFMRNGNRWKKS